MDHLNLGGVFRGLEKNRRVFLVNSGSEELCFSALLSEGGDLRSTSLDPTGSLASSLGASFSCMPARGVLPPHGRGPLELRFAPPRAEGKGFLAADGGGASHILIRSIYPSHPFVTPHSFPKSSSHWPHRHSDTPIL